MPEIEISVQAFNQGIGNHRASGAPPLAHRIQEIAVPRLAAGRFPLKFLRNPLENVDLGMSKT